MLELFFNKIFGLPVIRTRRYAHAKFFFACYFVCAQKRVGATDKNIDQGGKAHELRNENCLMGVIQKCTNVLSFHKSVGNNPTHAFVQDSQPSTERTDNINRIISKVLSVKFERMMSQTVTSSESMDYESFKGDSPLKRQSTESFKSAGVIPAAPSSNGSSLARSSSLRISRKKGTLASGQRDMRNLGKGFLVMVFGENS